MPEAVAEFSAEGHWVRLKLRGQFCCSIGFTFGEGGRSIELSDGNTRQSLGEIRMQGVNQSLVIEWAGDLDRDGKLDLIVADSTDHYDVRKRSGACSPEANPNEDRRNSPNPLSPTIPLKAAERSTALLGQDVVAACEDACRGWVKQARAQYDAWRAIVEKAL